MKRSILFNNKKTFPIEKVFEIIVLTFLICTFSVFMFLINKKPTEVIDNREEMAEVFKNSDIHEFLGFEKSDKEEEQIKTNKIQYIFNTEA